MNEQNLNQQSEETVNEIANERRAAFKQTGVLLGAALLGGLAGKRQVSAQSQGGTSQGGAMQDNMQGNMMSEKTRMRMARINDLTPRNEMGIPRTAVIKQAANAGPREQNDVAILNYALALEYLEADFYNRAVQADNARPYLRGRVKDLARILQRDETTHVQAVSDAIRSLGGTPISKPAFVFPDNAFISPIGFLMLSSELEETGVSAYLGQGQNVRRQDTLNFAASIYGNETRHAALIRHYLGNSTPRNMEMPLPMNAVIEKVRPFFADPQTLPQPMMKP
ncbi:MAG TPA: ferritin-like domain-containing protein [Abditibacteriaceae bacterium]|jgi:hypothetical protein